MRVEIPSRYAGPPSMGHGGYVAGFFAQRTKGAVQVTLRRPTPLDVALDLDELEDGRLQLRDGEAVLAESEPSTLDLHVPPAPSLEAARAAEAGSPSHFDGRGVHPTCFGCGGRSEAGLKIFAGPLDVDGGRQVAAVWTPGAALASADGSVDAQWVLAALDCPGAFAFIAEGTRAGLLGRIVFEQWGEVRADEEHIVTGWRIGDEGRKLFAGTALFDRDGTVLAGAKATWFQMS